jgi:hypothetical protein
LESYSSLLLVGYVLRGWQKLFPEMGGMIPFYGGFAGAMCAIPSAITWILSARRSHRNRTQRGE